jgi:hypothetical protein
MATRHRGEWRGTGSAHPADQYHDELNRPAATEPITSGHADDQIPIRLQCAIRKVLSESTSLTDATPRVLREICEALGWDYGGLWLVDPSAGSGNGRGANVSWR